MQLGRTAARRRVYHLQFCHRPVPSPSRRRFCGSAGSGPGPGPGGPAWDSAGSASASAGSARRRAWFGTCNWRGRCREPAAELQAWFGINAIILKAVNGCLACIWTQNRRKNHIPITYLPKKCTSRIFIAHLTPKNSTAVSWPLL